MRQLGRESALGGSASSEEEVDAVDVSMPCSVVDGRSPELVLGVDVRARLQQNVDRLGVSLASGVGEGSRLRVFVGDIDAREAPGRLDE